MVIQRRILKSFILFAGDVAVLYAALFIMVLGRYWDLPLGYYIAIHLPPFSIIFAVWIAVFYVSGLYELRVVKNTAAFYDRLYKTFLFNTAAALSVFYLLPYFQITPRANLFIVLVLAVLLILAWRWSAQNIMASRGRSRVLFFGITKEVVELADFLRQNPQLGYLPVGGMAAGEEEVEEKISEDAPFKIFSLTHNLLHIVRDEGIEIVVPSSEIKKNEVLIQMLFQVVPLGIPVFDFLSFYEASVGKIPVSLVGKVWFLENLVGVKKNYYEFFKRLLDLSVAFVLGIPAILTFPLVASAIKLDSPGTIFYKQLRVGKGGREFWLIKYRSMVKDADKMSGFKDDGVDTRHTKVGAVLRKSYLDELPQIINVVKGEMSFVGPRPERPEFVKGLKEKIPFYEMRLMVKSGITGWAQLNMENDASVEDALEKIQYDLAYIKNRSIWLDLTIAFKTVMVMLSRGGR